MAEKKKETKDPLDAVLANIEKSMGRKDQKPVFARFKNIVADDCPVIPFGVADIDAASYCGGVPRGKMIEIFGPESSGKSLVTLYLIASVQRMGMNAALVDVEQSFDPLWAARHGVDVDNLIYGNEFANGDSALEYTHLLCKSPEIALVVVDSTAALLPKSELEKALDENAVVGAQALLMSRACRKIMAACSLSNVTCAFVNQTREKIGVMYGNPETTPGGKALRFYSHQRIRVAKSSQIKVREGGKDVPVGQISTVTFVKNKVARPYGQCEFKIIFDKNALNPVVMLCQLAKDMKMVRLYKGLMRIPKEVFGNLIETPASSIPELAKYFVENDMVLKMLDVVEPAVNDFNEEADKKDKITIDDAILEMREDASKIVPPSGDVSISAAKIKDAKEEELGEEVKEVEEPE